MKSCTCHENVTFFTVSDKATNLVIRVPDAVTSCILESQLTAPFASITTAPDVERLVSRKAKTNSESVDASMLCPQPCSPYVSHTHSCGAGIVYPSTSFTEPGQKRTTHAMTGRVTVPVHMSTPTASRYWKFIIYSSYFEACGSSALTGLASPKKLMSCLPSRR